MNDIELAMMWLAEHPGRFAPIIKADITRLRAINAELLAALKAVIPAVAWGVGDVPISEYPTITDTKAALASARDAVAQAEAAGITTGEVK